MLQLAQRLRLNLADAFARDRKLLAHFLKCVIGVHPDSETHPQHPLLAGRERRQHAGGGFAQIGLNRRVDRQNRILVLNEVPEVTILLVADGKSRG